MSIQKIYEKLPFPLRIVAFNIYAFVNDRRRYGSSFKKVYEESLDRLQWSEETIRKFQRERLSRHLRVASFTKYWSETFAAYSVDVNGDPFEQLSKLPILTKDQVKRNLQSIFALDDCGKYYHAHTSGTTGGGLAFPTAVAAEHDQWAVWWRYRSTLGITQGDWCSLFGGRSLKPVTETKPPFHMTNYVSRQVSFSQYHLSPATIGDYIAVLNHKRIPWVHGYPSFLASVADLATAGGYRLQYSVRAVTLGAENLLDSQRDSITRFFGVEPHQHYGLAEGTANFSQLNGDSFLTVDEDFSFVEFVESSRGVRVVGTNFCNPAFPLFRYDCGDLVVGVDESCFPRRVARVDGRKEDSIVLPDGRRVGRLDHIFKDLHFVREAQILQRDVRQLFVKVVPFDGWDNDSEIKLISSFRDRLGSGLDITILVVDKIPRTAAGKLRFVVSEVNG